MNRNVRDYALDWYQVFEVLKDIPVYQFRIVQTKDWYNQQHAHFILPIRFGFLLLLVLYKNKFTHV